MDQNRGQRRRLLGGALLALTGARAQAQAARVRLLCASPAGGVPDLIARAYAEPLEREFGTGVTVENRPGGGGMVAIAAFKQPATAATALMLAHGSLFTTYPFLYAKLPYDPRADFVPLTLAAELTLHLAIGPAVPAEVQTLDGFLAWARNHPGACHHGTPGVGTMPHLLLEMLFRDAGITSQHVPYQGGPPALADLLGGRLAALVLPEGLLRPHAMTGRLRVLAATGEARSRFLPEVPTFAELGLPRSSVREWFAFVASPEMPAALRDSLAARLRQVAGTGALAGVLGQQSIRAVSSSAAALVDLIAADRRHWQPRIAALGLRLE